MDLPFGLTIRRRAPHSRWLAAAPLPRGNDRTDHASHVIADLLTSVSSRGTPQSSSAGRDRVGRVRQHRDRVIDRFEDELLVEDLLDRVAQAALVQRLAEQHPALVRDTIEQMRQAGLLSRDMGVEQ